MTHNMNANKAVDSEIDLRQNVITRLNQENCMQLTEQEEEEKVFQKEEKKSSQMISKRQNGFEIKTQDINNDMDDYERLDNFGNIMQSLETASNDSKSPRNETSNAKRKILSKNRDELQTVVSSKDDSINVLPLANNIYDGDRGENMEHNMNKKFKHHNGPLQPDSKLTDKGQEQNTFHMWRSQRIVPPTIYEMEDGTCVDATGVSIGKQAQLTETSKLRLPKCSNIKNIKQEQEKLSAISKSIPILPCIDERVLETGTNMTDVPYYVELSETSNMEAIRCKNGKRKKVGAFIICIMVMVVVAIVCYYFTPGNIDKVRGYTTDTNDVPEITATDDAPVTTATDDVPVTTAADAECYNLKASCNPAILKKITEENRIAAEELIRAARNGNITQVCDLLKCGASVNSHTDWATPLYIASDNGHHQVVKLLLRYNALVDQTGSYDNTPLYIAAENGDVNITQILLTYKASVDKPNSFSFTPLYIAALNGHVNVVQLLLTYNASVDKATQSGWTPLFGAAWNGHANVVGMLLKYNASIHKANAEGRTPLYAAEKQGHVNVVKLLRTYNA